MSFLSFLKDAVIEEVPASKVNSKVKKDRNPDPEFLGFRLWKDGSIFPSKALVERFDLEYKDRVKSDTGWAAPEHPGFGVDIIDSRKWNEYKNQPSPFVGFAVVLKDLPRVDLFANVRYDLETGKPLSSVMDQGTSSFGKSTLLPLLQEVYAVAIPEGEDYMDIRIGTDIVNLSTKVSNGIFLFPKKVMRGEDAGKFDNQRRENVKETYPLVPVMCEKDDVSETSNAEFRNEVDSPITAIH